MRRILTRTLLTLLLIVLPVGTASAMVSPYPHSDSGSAPRLSAAVTTPFNCTYSPEGEDLLNSASQAAWQGWIERLSGVTPVMVNNLQVTITSRHSSAMFMGTQPSRAFDYLKEQVLALYPSEQVREQDVPYFGSTFKNLIVTLPGQTHPDEMVILGAHFDDMPSAGNAPGADDNASGSASLLEAAYLLRDRSFDRTIQLVWFTGEEQGLYGSLAFVREPGFDPSKVLGMINLDMFGYDHDNDRCFELHVGTLAQSNAVGHCMTDTIAAYQLDLTYDYMNSSQATTRSDHYNFWQKGIGAVEVLENYTNNNPPLARGCAGSDGNPNYHTSADTLANMNIDTSYDINRVALASIAAMATIRPLEISHSLYLPLLMSK